MWPRIRSLGDTRTDTGVGPSFDDLPVLKGNLRLSSYLHRILDATAWPVRAPLGQHGICMSPRRSTQKNKQARMRCQGRSVWRARLGANRDAVRLRHWPRCGGDIDWVTCVSAPAD